MWYFAWILGVSLAVTLAVLNGMLCEARECALTNQDKEQ
jgi:cyd operon protein YbgT